MRFCNLSFHQKPEKYLEWYNAWMDSKHGLYVLHVADMSMQPYLISSRLQLNPLSEWLEAWCKSKGKTTPQWESLVLWALWVKEKLLSLRNRLDLIQEDIQSLACGLALFHMMKTTYICDKPGHRKSWIVDFAIYSVDKDASGDDTSQSTSKMKVRAHIYPDHSTQVNFSSHEYQPRNATIPGAHRTSKPTVWRPPSAFNHARLSVHLICPTPMTSQSSSPPVKSHGSRLSNESLRKSFTTITPRSDVKEEVLSTPKRSARVQGQGLMTLTPATATTEIDTTTPELAKLGIMVIEQLQNSGGAIRQIQDSMGAVQGPDATATRRVSMSTSGAAVQELKGGKA
jgi:hypothetical protein